MHRIQETSNLKQDVHVRLKICTCTVIKQLKNRSSFEYTNIDGSRPHCFRLIVIEQSDLPESRGDKLKIKTIKNKNGVKK